MAYGRRRGDILPDGSAILTVLPVKEDDPEHSMYLVGNANNRMDLTGVILLKEEDIVEGANGLDDSMMKSPLGLNKSDTTDFNNVEDIYIDLNQSRDEKNPIRKATIVSPKASSKNPNELIRTVKFQATFQADLRIDFIPDWM